jgi:hypothetical protein
VVFPTCKKIHALVTRVLWLVLQQVSKLRFYGVLAINILCTLGLETRFSMEFRDYERQRRRTPQHSIYSLNPGGLMGWAGVHLVRTLMPAKKHELLRPHCTLEMKVGTYKQILQTVGHEMKQRKI